MVDKAEMERIIQRGLTQNRQIDGNRSFRMRRRDDLAPGRFSFQPVEGSLS
jgi:(2Fe-2S) ferredoxin